MIDWTKIIAEALQESFDCPVLYLDPPYEDSPGLYIRVGMPDKTTKAIKTAGRSQTYQQIYFWCNRVDRQSELVEMMGKAQAVIEKALDDHDGLLFKTRQTIGYDTQTATTWLRGSLEIYYKAIE